MSHLTWENQPRWIVRSRDTSALLADQTTSYTKRFGVYFSVVSTQKVLGKYISFM